MILLAESDLFVFIHLDTRLEPPMTTTACSVVLSFGRYHIYGLPMYQFFFNNFQTRLFAVAMNE